jgi:hydroxyethylthiazole kinase-like uncharacterized protein yjeF
MYVVDSEQMGALDTRTIEEVGLPGIVLMERAALGVADQVRQRFPTPGRVTVLVGPGNNGGDGLAIARILAQAGWQASVLLAAPEKRIKGDAETNLKIARQLDVEVLDSADIVADGVLHSADVWIDALLGIGIQDAPTGAVADLIRQANEIRQSASPFVVAVDVPSGVLADDGTVPGAVISADLTVTFGFRKWGHLLPPGRAHVGSLEVIDIGIPEVLARGNHDIGRWFDESSARDLWKPIPVIAHKNSLGDVLVIGGSDRTPGAAILAADAALHSGAGLVSIAGSKWMRLAVVAQRPELMTLERGDIASGIPDRYGVVVFGPGLGLGEATASALLSVLESIEDRPLIIDADGLTALASMEAPAMPPNVILTPHPGELARLLRCETAAVVADLPAAATECWSRYGATVVAKTSGAVVVGRHLSFVDAGDPGMATGGSGDVLAGIIGGFAGRFDIDSAAHLGAWVHAQAGATAAQRTTSSALIASDIIGAMPDVFARLEP